MVRDHDKFVLAPVCSFEMLNGERRPVTREYKWRVRKRYEKLELISDTLFNKVCVADDSVTGNKVAIKLLSGAFSDEFHARKSCREIFILPRLNHRNVIKFLDAFSDIDLDEVEQVDNMAHLFIVMPFVETDLHQYLMSIMTQWDKQIEMTYVQVFMYQIFSALNYMHKKGLMHRDLNPSNVGLTSEGQILLLDFDFSRLVNRKNKEGHSIVVANPNYRAPEIVLTPGHYNNEVDIWSAGCIFAELLSISSGLKSKFALDKQFLQLPEGAGPIKYFESILKLLGPPTQDFYKVISGQEKEYMRECISSMASEYRYVEPDFASRYSFVSSDAKDLLKGLLIMDPKQRLSAGDAMEHRFFTDIHSDDELVAALTDTAPVSTADDNNNSGSEFVCPVDVSSDNPGSLSEIRNVVFAELHNFPKYDEESEYDGESIQQRR